MEIEPATLAQVRTGRDGRRVLIQEDVLGVARQLHDIDPRLRLFWNELGRYFVVGEVDQDGTERLVLTAQEADQRMVERVREISSPGYDFVKEMERQDARADRDEQHRFAEQTGEVGEKLAHALRKDLQAKTRVFVPKGASWREPR